MNLSRDLVGDPGTGKSEYSLRLLCEAVGDKSVLVLDPQADTSEKLSKQLSLLDHQPLIIDDLDATDLVVPFELLSVSTAQNDFVRENENRVFIEQLIEVIERGEEQRLIDTPMKYSLVVLAATLYQLLPSDIRNRLGVHALTAWLDHDSPIKRKLLKAIPDCDEKYRVADFSRFHIATYTKEVDCGRRLFERTIKVPPVAARIGKPTFDLDEFIRNRGVMVVQGGDAATFCRVAGIWAQKWIQASDLNDVPSVIFYEEANNYNMVGRSEERCLLTQRKRGTSLWFSRQLHDQTNPTHRVLDQGCGITTIFRCTSSEVSGWGAHKMAANIHNRKVDFVRERQLHDGFEEVHTWSVDHEQNERISQAFRPRYREIREPVYASRADQLFDLQQEIQYRLQPGEFYENNNGQVTRKYLPMLPPTSPWGQAAEHEEFELWMQNHRQHAEYLVTPNIVTADDLITLPANVTSSPSSKKTRPPLGKSTGPDSPVLTRPPKNC